MSDFGALKQRQQQAWASGDFGMIARATVIVGELLCEAVDLRPGQQVLDVATGTGSTALAAARRECEVVAVDWAPQLLERGRECAAAERLAVSFQKGEAAKLPFADCFFDAVLSTFGAMYDADQEQTANELVRVCRPGGKIGLANFTPESFRYRTPQQWLDIWRVYLGPLNQAFQRIEVRQRDALEADLLGLVRRFNESADSTMIVPSAYIEVVALRAAS